MTMIIDVEKFSCYASQVSKTGNPHPSCDRELHSHINHVVNKIKSCSSQNFCEQDLINYFILCILCGCDRNKLKRKSIIYYLSYSVATQAYKVFIEYQFLGFELDELFQIGWEIISDFEGFLRSFLTRYNQIDPLKNFAHRSIYFRIKDRATQIRIQQGTPSNTSSQWGSIRTSRCSRRKLEKALGQRYTKTQYAPIILAWECFNQVCKSIGNQPHFAPSEEQIQGILNLWQRRSNNLQSSIDRLIVDQDLIKSYLNECIEIIANPKEVSTDRQAFDSNNYDIQLNSFGRDNLRAEEINDVENLIKQDLVNQIRQLVPVIDEELMEGSNKTKLNNRIRIFILFGLECHFDADISKICGVNRSSIHHTINNNFNFRRLKKHKFLSLLVLKFSANNNNSFEFNDIARINQILTEELSTYYQNVVFNLFADKDEESKSSNEGDINHFNLLLNAHQQYINDKKSLIEKSQRNIPEESFLPNFLFYVSLIKNYIENHQVTIPQDAYPTLIKVTHPLIDLWQCQKISQQD